MVCHVANRRSDPPIMQPSLRETINYVVPLFLTLLLSLKLSIDCGLSPQKSNFKNVD